MPPVGGGQMIKGTKMNQQVNSFRPVTVATPGTPCGWQHVDEETDTIHTCESGKPAVHVLTQTLPVAEAGTALCGFHSPFDVTQAERDTMATVPATVIDGHMYGRESGLPIFRNVTDNSPGILARHRAEQAKADVLADMLTLSPVAEAPAPLDMVKFHKLSPAMVALIKAIAVRGGKADSWQMRNDIASLPGVTARTRTALEARGILDSRSNPDTSGSMTLFFLTDRGREIAAILLPDAPMAQVETETESPALLTLLASLVRDGDLYADKRYANKADWPAQGFIEAGVAQGLLKMRTTAPDRRTGTAVEVLSYTVEGRALVVLCEPCAQASHGSCERLSCPCRCLGDATYRTGAQMTWERESDEYRRTHERGQAGRTLFQIAQAVNATSVRGDEWFNNACALLHMVMVREANGRIIGSQSAEQISARHAREEFQMGDPYTFRVVTVPAKYYQDRPFACRNGCTCGTCNGVSFQRTEMISRVVSYVSGGLEVHGHLGGHAVIRPDRLD